MSDDEDDDLASDIATTEKYRSRSRSVATLTAAAAGALSAGLALNPSLVDFPVLTRMLGLTTIFLLIFATGAFVVASVLHARSVNASAKLPSRVSRLLRPWEALFISKDEWPSSDEYRLSVDSVQRQIMRVTDIGMWIATGAILSLIAALLSLTVLNEQRTIITVSVSPNSSIRALCPSLPEQFDATARSVEVSGSSDIVTLTLAGNLCERKFDATPMSIAVPRLDLAVLIPTP